MIGLRVGPFEIVESADVPEPGDWYYARRSGMSQRKPTEVLVRVLAPDADGDARVELQQHFENLRQVEHARVPIAVAMYEGIGAMAITSVRASSMSQVISGRDDDSIQMSPATLLDLLLEVAEILQFAHHRGRAHGHLQPDRLQIAVDGTIWVFGYAAGTGSEATPAWTAPERARGSAATEHTDQWSLAAFGAALITGKAPWTDDDPMAQARQGDPESIVEPVERQWPALARLFRKMLDNRPENRFPTMHQVRQELLALARKAGGTSNRRELGAALNHADLPPQPAVGDTLTPPDIDPEPEPEPEVQTTAPVPPPEEQTVPLEAAVEVVPSEVEPETPADIEEEAPSEVDDPEIQVARTIETQARPAAAAPLPAEEIPVVRPDIDGDVPAAGRGDGNDPFADPLVENTGPTMLADIAAIAKAHGLDVSKLTDAGFATDAAPNIEPHPAHDPKSVADPPSIPLNISPEDHAADYEATVMFSQDHIAGESSSFAISDSGEVEVEVEYTDESEVNPLDPTPTLSPDSDAGLHSEELPAPTPEQLAQRPVSEPGFLPDKVPDSVAEEPELGSMNGDVSIRMEPDLGLDDDRPDPPAKPLPPADDTAQKIALGAIALMVLLMLVWAATRVL